MPGTTTEGGKYNAFLIIEPIISNQTRGDTIVLEESRFAYRLLDASLNILST